MAPDEHGVGMGQAGEVGQIAVKAQRDAFAVAVKGHGSVVGGEHAVVSGRSGGAVVLGRTVVDLKTGGESRQRKEG